MISQTYPTRPISNAGFSLLELVVATTVMSIIAVVVMPIIMTATDAYAVSRDSRADTDRVIFALERAARVIRQAPMAAGTSGLDVQTATQSSLVFSDGNGFEINNSEFQLLEPGGRVSVLCSDVDEIRLTYFDQAGNPMNPVDPSQVHRVNLQIQSGPIILDMYTFPRAWIGSGG